MPSHLHEGLLTLFRNRPSLAPELLRDVLRVKLPAFTEARIESGSLSVLKSPEFRADLLVVLTHLDGASVEGIVVEAKRSLVYSDMSISQIAYWLGFQDPAYFTRFFTRMCSESPTRYREQKRVAAVKA